MAIFDATNSTESRRRLLVRCLATMPADEVPPAASVLQLALQLVAAAAGCTSMQPPCRVALCLAARHRQQMLPCLRLQRQRFHGKWQYLFIESICNDSAVLEQNYRHKMMYSADYKDVNTEEARHAPLAGSHSAHPQTGHACLLTHAAECPPPAFPAPRKLWAHTMQRCLAGQGWRFMSSSPCACACW